LEKVSIKVEFLASSNWEKERNIVRLKVDSHWIEHLRSYYREHKNEQFRATLEVWDSSTSEGAFRLFHEIRDRICASMGDTSQEHKDHIKEELKKLYGEKDAKGNPKHTKQYTVSDWSKQGGLIDGAFVWAHEAGADVKDLETERIHSGKKEA
jgi:hypothetical protein